MRRTSGLVWLYLTGVKLFGCACPVGWRGRTVSSWSCFGAVQWVAAQAGLQPPLGCQRGLTQSAISTQLGQAHVHAWKAQAGTDDICRLHACSSDGADTVLNLTPSHTLGTNLSKDDFLTCVGSRLGVDVCFGSPAWLVVMLWPSCATLSGTCW